MVLIGKGSFTKCYLLDCEKKVLLLSDDKVKEVMSLGWFPESSLFPKVEQVDNDTYTMKYYPKVKSLKKALTKRHYEYYTILRDIYLSYGEIPTNPYDYYSYYYEKFSSIRYKALREALIEALDACSNLGSDIGFEISPRNVAVDNGKLILLDTFFSLSQLKGKKS